MFDYFSAYYGYSTRFSIAFILIKKNDIEDGYDWYVVIFVK